ncbi:MAG: nitroreductase family protein [Candidatus Eisenbacteria bacterium]
MSAPNLVPLPHYCEFPLEEMTRRASEFRARMQLRRTVRHFASRPVPRAIIEDCLLAAGTAPSGANLQPWHFVVVSDPTIKHRIREAAEKEEHAFYHGRAPQDWLDALAPLGTDECKEYLDTAPYLIAVFAQTYGVNPDGTHLKHYYAQESVGIATGMLVTALHHAGLVTLTHTPSPMGFLNEVLQRPSRERPFVLVVTGYPDPAARVPEITKKRLEQIATFL